MITRELSLLAVMICAAFTFETKAFVTDFSTATTATFYTNTFTNSAPTIRDHFHTGGGGYGSFEINEATGLELISEAPNWYESVRALKTPLPAGFSWQVTVRAHMADGIGAGQANPSYVASLVLLKVARNSDGFASVLSSAPNRQVLSFTKTDGFGFGLQQHVNAYRKSKGDDIQDDRHPLGSAENVLLRLTYTAANKQLVASYSLDGEQFTEFDAANLGSASEWSLTDSDQLAVALSVSTVPYVHVDTPARDFYSTYDSYGMGEYDPSLLPEITYSVGAGQLFFRDLSVVYAASNWDASGIQYQTLPDGTVRVVSWSDGAIPFIAVPEIIDGKLVTEIGPYAFIGSPNYENLLGVVLPQSLKTILNGAFSNLPNLESVTMPLTLERIGGSLFGASPKVANVVLPDRFLFQQNDLGLEGTAAYRMIVQQVADSLAENELFMAALATNEKFIGLLVFKILSRFQAYGLVTRNDLSNYATVEQINKAFTSGQADGVNSVVSNPNAWQLYTANQVSGLSIGDLTLTRQENGSFVLNYDIEQSDDLETWTTYQNYGEELIGLPEDKQFLRIRVKQ
jgi:hypothetical protein